LIYQTSSLDSRKRKYERGERSFVGETDEDKSESFSPSSIRITKEASTFKSQNENQNEGINQNQGLRGVAKADIPQASPLFVQ
jgi:hypothetical protein